MIHEFAWGKSKEEDEAFTFSPTPTPTRSSIYIEYVKKELAQRLKELTEKKSLKTTPQPLIDKSKYVYDKFHTKQMLPKTTKSTGMEIDEQFIQDVHKYENPNHFIEKITQQRNQGTQPHTVIKKTHITIDEVEKHTDGNNASENIEKFIELDESETDIEGEEAYASVTTYGHTAQSKPEANVEVLNDREAEPWLPVAVSQAAVNVAKDLNKSDQPHGNTTEYHQFSFISLSFHQHKVISSLNCRWNHRSRRVLCCGFHRNSGRVSDSLEKVSTAVGLFTVHSLLFDTQFPHNLVPTDGTSTRGTRQPAPTAATPSRTSRSTTSFSRTGRTATSRAVRRSATSASTRASRRRTHCAATRSTSTRPSTRTITLPSAPGRASDPSTRCAIIRLLYVSYIWRCFCM